MSTRLLLTAAVLCYLPLAAAATTPNIETGQWEYVNVTEFEGDVPPAMQSQTHTSQECVTEEDLARGDAFLEEAEACDVRDMDMRRDGMSYTMVCREDGSEVQMDADMRFLGDRVEGVVTADMETPMGPMSMRTTVEGRRVGDCP